MSKKAPYINIKVCLGILLLLFSPLFLTGKEIQVIQFSGEDENISIGKSVWLLKDFTGKLNFKDIVHSRGFKKSKEKVPTFWFTSAKIWVKFKIKNTSSNDNLLLNIGAPLIDETELFYFTQKNKFESIKIGQNTSFFARKYKQPGYIYDLNLKSGESGTYYLKISSHDQIQVPLNITTPIHLFSSFTTYNFVFGIYCGIMLIMMIYNLFVFFTVKDKSYLYYVIYILAVTLTQTTFQGYTFKYLWPASPSFEKAAILLMSVFVGVTSIEFLRVFTNTKKYLPKMDKYFVGAHLFYLIIAILTIAGLYRISWMLTLSIVSPLSMFMLFVVYKIAHIGYRPAKFFAISWTIFLIGVFIYAMKDFGILPYNNYTIYTMPVGSAIETVLLSFALADKINIFRKEKEEAQLKTVEALQENEKMIRDQNIVLEQKVEERTTELKQTLNDLKEAQSQLVDAEKMSSLGQLTAGIAHEINNPINFVSSNIAPLRQDIDDLNAIIKKYEELENADNITEKLKEIEALKKELDFDYLQIELVSIIGGIEDGAKRTAEIVSGLRNFSRLDEGDLKDVNINEGIEATLILIKNKLNRIKIEKSLGSIPDIECNPGKINQLVMNLIDNAIYAIEKKDIDNKNGIIEVITKSSENTVILTIKDNGIGIPENIKDKLFDPFFTTKDIGEGTGLGLSIVRSIIDEHQGKVSVNSEVNKGSEIIIEIPIKREKNGKN